MKILVVASLVFALVACNLNTEPALSYSPITLPGGAEAVLDSNGAVIAGGDVVVGESTNLPEAATNLEAMFNDSLGTAGHGAPVGTRLWAGNIIPYTINANLDPKFYPLIDQAVQDYATKTNLRLVKRTNQRYFVEIAGATNPSFCGLASSIGLYRTNTISATDRRTYGLSRNATHFIILNNTEPACVASAFVVIHEFGHILGLRHEQSRPDRDTYIRIDTTALNNDPLYVSAYNYKYGTDGRLNAYDLNSVMHYKAIFRKTGLQAIYPIQDPNYPVSQIGGNALSVGDVEMTKTLYPNAPQ